MVKAKLRTAGGSDPGRVRKNNEDALHLDPDRGIFLVVDGIGGQAAGEKAAEIAVSRLRARLERQTGTVEQRIREAIAMANNEILRAASENAEWQGMACVLTVAVLDEGAAVIGHVGDSRLYQLRRGEIVKITHDHSPVGEREDSGELTEAEAMRHPRRNEVFRDVGSEEHTPDDPNFIEIRRIPFDPESAILLCSDGLSDQVPSAAILEIVERRAADPDLAVKELIAAANQAGGKDNVTVVLVEGEDFTPPAPPAKPRSAWPIRWMVALAAAVALAGAGGFFLGRQSAPKPPVVVSGPRILTAGNGAAFASIAAALADAHPGDTVEVLPGEYREQVRLPDRITVRSRVPLEASLRAPALSNGPAVIAENVHNARLSGFRIVGDAQLPLSAGIVLTNSGVEIDNVEVHGAGLGIEVRGGSGTSLSASAVEDCLAEGVLITGAAAPWIAHNTFRRNKGAGLAARDGARPVLRDNLFEKNTVELPPDLLEAARASNVFPPPATLHPAPRGKKQ
ncbi:MAG TPA: protein phosphatase 2C domain-containing protein [Candidatus Sulfopaludibacter sp.]|jgi:serine/threonine protein phosphatase PrpC|nr:protein phosphatase 2C domain-containing protein [Candidatus Sulfopaludibacter sp.]